MAFLELTHCLYILWHKCSFKLAAAPLLGWLWSEVYISLLASCPGFPNKAVVPPDGFMASQQLLK